MDSFSYENVRAYHSWTRARFKAGDTREFPISLHSLYHLREQPPYKSIWDDFAFYVADARIRGTL